MVTCKPFICILVEHAVCYRNDLYLGAECDKWLLNIVGITGLLCAV